MLATQGGLDARGAVFTRSEVVHFILDLAGYTVDQPLHTKQILEPSFGAGDFLLPIVDRLLAAWQAAKPSEPTFEALHQAIRAVELHRETFDLTRAALQKRLCQQGISEKDAVRLSDAWLAQGDFLLTPLEGQFDFVIGNPPYVRQELIPATLLAEYRARYSTMYDRADLYIPFLERSLRMLREGGCLGFICADRWMKNRYGGPLRKLVAENFHLKVYIDMTDTPAFHRTVIAYPAITIIEREKPGATRIAHRPEIDSANLTALAQELRAAQTPTLKSRVQELTRVASGAEPWLLHASDQMAFLRRLEREYPTLEEAGCKVGIGVATGADQAFIDHYDSLDVEPDRKLPLVTTRDIALGNVQWRGLGVINPFSEQGDLVDLRDYPRLRRYLEERADILGRRHCAKKNPSSWYRTIDRIWPALASTPKLLIPDIKGEAHIVFEEGKLYPHHNLYYVVSKQWDLKALQAVLLSRITRLFVATYSTKIRGGYFRFQAQYLRRIRIPHWKDVPEALRYALIEAAERRDIEACDRAAYTLYSLTPKEQSLLTESAQ